MGAALVMLCDVDLDVPDGARTHTVEVASGFARAGLDVTLIARGSDPGADGVTFRPARGRETQRLGRLLSLNLQAIAALVRQRPAGRQFYVRHNWTTMPASIAARALGYAVVSEVDDVPYGPTYHGEITRAADWVKRAMTFLMGRVSRGVVAGTPEAKALLAREFRVPSQRIGVVPIGVDVDFFAPADRRAATDRAGLDPGLRYLLFVGHFAPWVDFETLLGAFAILSDRHPDLRLLLVGDGAQRDWIESELRRLGLERTVILTGFIRDRERVRDLLAASTVALASHRGEHLDRIGMNATKLMEYLAAGRPVVAKDVARLREMIQETGAGAVASDAAGMADAIEQLLIPGEADRVGARARALAEARYSWAATVRTTLGLFEPRAR